MMTGMVLLPKLLPQGLSITDVALFLLSGLSVGHLALQTGMFQGIRMIAPATIVAEIIYPSIRLFLFWLLVAMGMHFQGALIALLISGILSAGLGAVWLRSRITTYVAPVHGDLPSKSNVAHYVGPIVLARLINLSIVAGMPLLMGWLASAKDVAHFGAASRLSMLVSIVIISVSAMFAPTISAYHAQGRMTDLKILYQKVSTFTFMVASPVISACVFFPVEIMRIFGSEFQAGATYLVPLALGQLIVVSLGAADQIVLMRGNSKLLMITTAIGSGLSILLALILQPIIGPVAFALGTAIGLSSAQLIILAVAWRQDDLHPFDQDMIKLNIIVWLAMAMASATFTSAIELRTLAFTIEMLLVTSISMKLVHKSGILIQIKQKFGLGGQRK
jgi:O-antigen/teichoic acid export membrane protein